MRQSGMLLAAVVAASAFCLATAEAQTVAPSPQERARMEGFVDGAVREAMASRHIAGATAAVIDRDGIVMTRGYGQAGQVRQVDSDTLFRVGSISKTLTWIAIMQLVEQGKLGLDDPINEHLPVGLRIPDDDFDEPIRVRNLITHTAGFEDSVLGHLFAREPARVLSLEDYLVRYRVQRVRPPGQLSVYSNYGAALAGAIVAHESGMDWPTYAERRILHPLGMMSATFREPYSAEVAATNHLPQPMPAEIAARVTQGYRFATGGYEAAPFEFVTHGSPAGSLSASANDMALYMQALLDPARMAGAGVLSEANARALNEPLFANHPALGAWRHGFMTFDLGGGRWAFGHGGSTIYQHSLLMVSRELGLGVFISTNTDTGYRMLAPLSQAFIREFYPITEELVGAGAAKADARYAGTYRPFRRAYGRTERAVLRLIGAIEVTTAQNGDLIVTGGSEPQRLKPLGDGVYQSATSPARGAFREADGRMRLYDTWGLGPMERIGFFESSKWLALIAGLGVVVALWGVTAGVRRTIARRETAGDLLFDGLCFYWLAGFGLFAAALAPWVGSDESAIVFGYPGRLFPVACWALASAALVTLLAIAALLLVRPRQWSWLRWLRAGACASVFAALSVTLWSWGFLGYSGF